jgi:ATP-dependent helicase/nuclease subunit A
VEKLFISPSHLAEESEKWRVVEDDREEPPPQAIKLGLLCHKVLEEWDFSTPSSSTSLILKEKIIGSARLFELTSGDSSSDAVIREAESLLSHYLKSKHGRRLSQAKIIGREIPFLYPRGDKTADLSVMRGVIDLLYERDGKTIVADYKTSQVNLKNMKKTAKKYFLQGEAYQEAVRRVLKRDVAFEVVFLRLGKSVFLSSSRRKPGSSLNHYV